MPSAPTYQVDVASGPTYQVTVASTETSYTVDVSTGPTYQVAMQLGTGPSGAAATVAVHSTTTLAAGSKATVTNVGTAAAVQLDFGIPAGADGTGTMNGPAGAVDGHMAVFDGTTGALVKDGGAPLALGTTSTTALAGNTAFVPPTRTVNSKALSANVTLAASDVGAASSTDSRFAGVPVSSQTTNYTLVAADAGSIVEVNSASAVTVTVPASTFAAGQIVEICQYGAGQVTIAAGSGVTLDNANGLKTAKQYSSASIRFRSATEAVVSGDTAV